MLAGKKTARQRHRLDHPRPGRTYRLSLRVSSSSACWVFAAPPGRTGAVGIRSAAQVDSGPGREEASALGEAGPCVVVRPMVRRERGLPIRRLVVGGLRVIDEVV